MSLLNCAKHGYYDGCLKALDAGENPNMDGDHKWTALHWAAYNGYPKCIELLLSKGANPNQVDFYGFIPLYLAVYNGHERCIQLLLECGVQFLNCEEWVSGHWIIYKNYEKCVKFILKKYANFYFFNHPDVTKNPKISKLLDFYRNVSTDKVCV